MVRDFAYRCLVSVLRSLYVPSVVSNNVFFIGVPFPVLQTRSTGSIGSRGLLDGMFSAAVYVPPHLTHPSYLDLRDVVGWLRHPQPSFKNASHKSNISQHDEPPGINKVALDVGWRCLSIPGTLATVS